MGNKTNSLSHVKWTWMKANIFRRWLVLWAYRPCPNHPSDGYDLKKSLNIKVQLKKILAISFPNWYNNIL
ncbi:hypothetical protein ACEE67_10665 [Streptococcus thoraltensis]